MASAIERTCHCRYRKDSGQKNPFKAVRFEVQQSSSKPRYDEVGNNRKYHQHNGSDGAVDPRGNKNRLHNAPHHLQGNRSWKAVEEGVDGDDGAVKPVPKKKFEVVDTAKLLEERKKKKNAKMEAQKKIHTKKVNLLSSQMSELRKVLKGLPEDGGSMEIMIMKKITAMSEELKASELKIKEADKCLGLSE